MILTRHCFIAAADMAPFYFGPFQRGDQIKSVRVRAVFSTTQGALGLQFRLFQQQPQDQSDAQFLAGTLLNSLQTGETPGLQTAVGDMCQCEGVLNGFHEYVFPISEEMQRSRFFGVMVFGETAATVTVSVDACKSDGKGFVTSPQ